MSIVKITATINKGKDKIVRSIEVNEKDYEHSYFEDILWNEENYLRKEMGKEYGQPVDFVDWEVIKEEDNDR